MDPGQAVWSALSKVQGTVPSEDLGFLTGSRAQEAALYPQCFHCIIPGTLVFNYSHKVLVT